MKIKEKILKEIQQCNTRLDYYNQEISIITDNPRKKHILNEFLTKRRIENSKLTLLRDLLR